MASSLVGARMRASSCFFCTASLLAPSSCPSPASFFSRSSLWRIGSPKARVLPEPCATNASGLSRTRNACRSYSCATSVQVCGWIAVGKEISYCLCSSNDVPAVSDSRRQALSLNGCREGKANDPECALDLFLQSERLPSSSVGPCRRSCACATCHLMTWTRRLLRV